MDCDEVNQSHNMTFNQWSRMLGKYNTDGIMKLASMYNKGLSCDCVQMKNGSFNFCFKVIFTDETAWAIRFPIGGKCMYPDEKVRREAAIISFIEQNTRIPVPKLIAWGTAAENHDPDMGPFLITEWVEGVSLSSIMDERGDSKSSRRPMLRSDIDDDTLYSIYRQMANILLELSVHDFDKIGALSVTEHDGQLSWPVSSRPLSLKMNEIESGGNVKMDDFNLPPFETVTEYLEYLLQQNTHQLHQQRNSIDNLVDAQRKYAVRQKAKTVIRNFVYHDSGPFKLYCEDFRPGNIIVDPETMKIVAVVDLEWTYTAPYQFLFSPPPWLILEKPTSWLDEDFEVYKVKFAIFLKSLQDEEEEWEKEGRLKRSSQQQMSTLMRRSMEDGSFWFGELLREVFNFDGETLWPMVESFVGQTDSIKTVEILEEIDDTEMHAFVERKMEDLRLYNLELESREKAAAEEAKKSTEKESDDTTSKDLETTSEEGDEDTGADETRTANGTDASECLTNDIESATRNGAEDTVTKDLEEVVG